MVETSRGNLKLINHIDVAYYYCPYVPPNMMEQVIYENDKIILKNYTISKIDQIKKLATEYNFTLYNSENNRIYYIENISDEVIFYLKLKELL